jgi:Domain of unknown function (DUF4328)
MLEPVAPASPRPVRGAALAASLGLAVVQMVELVSLFTRLDEVRTATTASEHVARVLNVLQSVGVAVAGTTFLVWLFQARRNAEVIGGVRQRWGTPWLVLGWVVPVVNLWIPRRIMIDIWKASEPERPALRPYALVDVWWGCFLAGNLGGNLVGSLLAVRHATKAANVVYALNSVFAFVAAVLAGFMIREISRSQERAGRHPSVTSPAAVPPAPLAVTPPAAGPPDPLRRRQTVLVAVLFGALGVLIAGLALLAHTTSAKSPEKAGYRYGVANPDPTVTDCNAEGERRYRGGAGELDFALGCLKAQTETLNATDVQPTP